MHELKFIKYRDTIFNLANLVKAGWYQNKLFLNVQNDRALKLEGDDADKMWEWLCAQSQEVVKSQGTNNRVEEPDREGNYE